MLQLFNEINRKKLEVEDYNILKGILNNYLFLYILGVTLIIQIVIVQLGGDSLACHSRNATEHILAVSFGLGGIAVTFTVRYLLYICKHTPQNTEEGQPLLL